MKKNILILTLTITTFAFSSCGAKTEKERFKDSSVELACEVMKPAMDNLKSMMENPEDPLVTEKAMNMQTDMESKLEEIVKKHSFENSEAWEKAGKNYENDEDFENEIKEAIKSKCDFNVDEDPPSFF